ncbi:hypothetical protein Q5752_001817 [Cryptotrichosporon argae]
MAEPRRSTDEETAPLLDHERHEHGSFLDSILHPAHKLTRLEKILATVAILFFLLASLFVGLFAGTEHVLHKERAKPGKVETVTHTRTATATATATTTATTTYAPEPTGKPAPDVCLTPDCIRLSASILSSLNTSADPCDDFYAYAVGDWLDSHDIPPDKGLYGAFNEVADNNKKVILRILNGLDDASHDNLDNADKHNLKLLKSVYDGCVDVDALNDIGIEPLVSLVDNVLDYFGPFDVASSSKSDDFDSLSSTPWRNTFNDAYVLPKDLEVAAANVEDLKAARRPVAGLAPLASDESEMTLEPVAFDKERRERITKALAFLHSRGTCTALWARRQCLTAGISALINFEIEGDAGGEDSQIQSLWVYQASGGLPAKQYYEEAPILDLYQSVIATLLTEIAKNTKAAHAPTRRAEDGVLTELIEELLAEVENAEAAQSGWPWPWPGDDKGGDQSEPKPEPPKKGEPLEARMNKLAGEVIAFERELIRAGADPEYLYNPHFSYNPYAMADVEKALPILSLPTYLSTFAPRSFPVNITVTHPPYLKSVSRIVTDTPDRVLSAYFVVRAGLTYAGVLGPKVEARQATRRLQEVLRGLKKGTEEDRTDVCLGWVDETVGFIAGREFVREAFSAEAKADGEHIIRSIVQAFDDKLPHISWMDAESAAAAQKKARAIIPKVGYPLYPNTSDPTSLAGWYRTLSASDSFFGTVVAAAVADESRAWLTLGRRRNREGWLMYPQTVNAYYNPPDGEIVFPAGILQPPFYSYNWPAYLRYGAFGAVAAHELTHAFDNSGSQYDEAGRLRDWWTNATVEAFEERAQCVAKQYSQYFVFDDKGNKVHINGNVNIADSGLAQAYAAWQASRPSASALARAPEARLPGLDYSAEQLFFLAFARVWAQLTRPATAVSRIRTDPHSPPYWRATGTLTNLGAFHDAFRCKVGSRMNPPKKEQCSLW